MPQGSRVMRADKLTKLVAVFDQFHEGLAMLGDARAKQLVANWADIRERYVRPEGTPRSALAAGMEQGLRETPMLLASMGSSVRKLAADSLTAAIAAHYPEFLAKDAERLKEVKSRGFIRGENDYYLVRHHIDTLEGEAGRKDELRKCYEMVDRFEAKHT